MLKLRNSWAPVDIFKSHVGYMFFSAECFSETDLPPLRFIHRRKKNLQFLLQPVLILQGFQCAVSSGLQHLETSPREAAIQGGGYMLGRANDTHVSSILDDCDLWAAQI